jgi:hypothetical protein
MVSRTMVSLDMANKTKTQTPASTTSQPSTDQTTTQGVVEDTQVTPTDTQTTALDTQAPAPTTTVAPDDSKKRQKLADVEDIFDAQGMPIGIKWTFTNGFVSTWNVEDFSALVQAQAKVHGFTQKGSDCYSGAGKFGPDAVNVAIAAHLKVLDQLKEGDWVRSGKGESREEPLDVLVDAFAQSLAADGKPANKDKIRARLTSGPDGGKAARAMIRKIPEVNTILLRSKSTTPTMASVADWDLS